MNHDEHILSYYMKKRDRNAMIITGGSGIVIHVGGRIITLVVAEDNRHCLLFHDYSEGQHKPIANLEIDPPEGRMIQVLEPSDEGHDD